MNIYQLCGPQEHDDNDNITSGFCQDLSNYNADVDARSLISPLQATIKPLQTAAAAELIEC